MLLLHHRIGNNTPPLGGIFATQPGGVCWDKEVYTNKHVSLICQSCQYHIRALRHIRPILDANTARLVGHALVSSRLDYANSIMYGMSKSLTAKLQHQQNMLARVVLRTNRLSSAGPLLNELHWLPVASRIHFKIATLTHKILSTGTPSYLSSLLSHYKPTRQLRSSSSISWYNHPPKLNSALLHSTQLHLWSGMACCRCQVIPFASDLQENAQNSSFPQPSHLGHVLVPRLRFVLTGPPRTLSLRPWRVFQIVIIIIIIIIIYYIPPRGLDKTLAVSSPC